MVSSAAEKVAPESTDITPVAGVKRPRRHAGAITDRQRTGTIDTDVQQPGDPQVRSIAGQVDRRAVSAGGIGDHQTRKAGARTWRGNDGGPCLDRQTAQTGVANHETAAVGQQGIGAGNGRLARTARLLRDIEPLRRVERRIVAGLHGTLSADREAAAPPLADIQLPGKRDMRSDAGHR
jgi:hypothetical protein